MVRKDLLTLHGKCCKLPTGKRGKIIVEKKKAYIRCDDGARHEPTPKDTIVLLKSGQGKTYPFSSRKKDEYTPTSGRKRVRRMKVIGVEFKGPMQTGDFSHMILSSHHPGLKPITLYLFNDNVMQFRRSYDDATRSFIPLESLSGGGNAIIRPYQVDNKAMGVPTGPNWTSLTDDVKKTIDDAFERIADRLLNVDSMSEIDTIYFSSSPKGKLGLGIFAFCTGEDVVDYITSKLRSFPQFFNAKRNYPNRA